MASKIKGLQMWCKKMTEGYTHVDIANFTTSWRNGMAFCALIHRFRPDLIDFDSLSPDNVFDNCKMAFEIAEKELSIPAFLEASDMVRLKVPDKLSIITYVSQYYNYLHALPQLGGPGVKAKVSTNKSSSGTKRPPDTDVSQAPTFKKATTDVKENAVPETDKTPQDSLSNRCAICYKQVYLLERHMDGGKLYHRSCFRHSELSPTNKVYSRSPFLSPSLNSESPASPTHLLADARVGHGDGLRGDKKESTPGSTLSTNDKLSNAKKQEAVGMKHSLVEPDRDDSKKSKLLPGNNASDAKTALKERLEGLKSYNTDKDRSNENSMPLSSKEAKKLEKRKAEIISSEKSAETATKGSKRSIPLIFQKKEEVKPFSSSVQSFLSPSSTTTPDSSSSVNKPPSDSSHTDNQLLRGKLKTEVTVNDLNVKNLKKNLDSVSNTNSEATKVTNPTAKPRSLAPKLVVDVSPSKKSTLHSEISLNKGHSPKPAPRRLFTESNEKKSAPDRPKDLAISHTEQKNKVETPGSSTPPPLPSTLPPTTSKSFPPALPSVSPTSSHTVTDNSSKQSATPLKIQTAEHSHAEKKQTTPVQKDSYKSSDKRWSVPASLDSPAVLVSPVEKKDVEHVKSGLLSSLAMVRNRTMSTPGSTPQNLSTQPVTLTLVSDQSYSKFTNANKSKEGRPHVDNQFKKQTDTTVKPSNHNISTPIKVPERTYIKNTAHIKSQGNFDSSGAVSTLKNVSMPPEPVNQPNQTNTKSGTVKENTKSSTFSLASILKKGPKKSSETDSKVVLSQKNYSLADKTEGDHFSPVSINIKLNEKPTDSGADAIKSDLNVASFDTKSAADDKVNAVKFKISNKNELSLLDSKNSDGEEGSANVQTDKVQEDGSQTLLKNVVDIPQWKINLEERKKKMREEDAKGDLSTIRSKHTSSINDRPKSLGTIDLLKDNELSGLKQSEGNNSARRKSVDHLEKNKENEFKQILDAKAKLSKPKPATNEPAATIGKLDWQVEAEKKMASIAALDKQLSKQDTGASQKLDSSQPQISTFPATDRSKLNLKEENLLNKNTLKTKVDTNEPEFMTNKSKLKSVEGNGSSQLNQKDMPQSIDEQKSEISVSDDFRVKLKHLKHVNSDGGSAKEIKNVTHLNVTLPDSKVVSTEPVRNQNNNNVTTHADFSDVSNVAQLTEKHSTPLTSNTEKSRQVQINPQAGEIKIRTVSIETKEPIKTNRYQTSNGGNSMKTHFVDIDLGTDTLKSDSKDKISPKVKRKITVFGTNHQGVLASPPESPNLKKVPVGKQFSFDSSTESSLTEPTSKMSINDYRTPPPRPPPPSGKVISPSHISVIELQQQLLDIDSRLTELEIRGRDLEDSIRKVNPSDDNDDDDLMKEWFSLVTEKNELVRKEADLVYVSREQELENEQEKIESQLRYLMSLPDQSKSPVEKEEEEYLITRKLQLVEQRNFIVDSIDEDRLRYEEEDRNIKEVLEEKGLWKDDSGMTRALKGKKVARSIFYT
ncbi:hypothetical protein Btru_035814 [Bulinus truncatus]|nr:hypothetical protein Btru_035814 [Bulinus truncatus]